MSRRRSRFISALWLLTIALFAARIGGAHLHLCMDGAEPPVSLHVEPQMKHHGAADGDTGHKDRDVDLSSTILIKKLAGFDELPVALLGALFLLCLLPLVKRLTPISDFSFAAFAAPLDLRPPPRGPPA